MLFLLVIIGALTYVVLYYQNVRKYPKGPMPLPIIGNLYHLNPEGLPDYLHEIGKEYGHCFTLFMPHPVVYFTDFSLIKETLVTQGEHFIGRSQVPPEDLLHKVLVTVRATRFHNLIFREQRRAALRIKREHGMGKNLMEAQVNQSIDELLKQLKESNDGVKPFDMNMPIQLCVGNVNETLFGYQFKYSNTAKFEFFINCLNRHLRGLRDNIWVLRIQAWPWALYLPILGHKGYTVSNENIAKYQNFIEEEVNKVAKVYNTNEGPTNFVQSMANLYAIVVDFWLAGMETTSTTLRWGLLHLMKHPQVQEKMRAEMLSVVGRERTTDSVIPALTLPHIYSVLKDDSVFERPTEFVPERFLEADGKTACKKQLDRLIPFGMSKRQCVGEALARMELFLILGTLLINYRFDAGEPIDLTPIGGQVNVPRPYKCTVVPL